MIYDIIKTVVLFYAEILWWVVRPFYELFEWTVRKLLKIRTVEEHRSEMRLLNEVLRDKYQEIRNLKRQVAALEFKSQPFEKAVVPFKEEIAWLEEGLAAKDGRIKALERDVERYRSELTEAEEEKKRQLGLYWDRNRSLKGWLEDAKEKITDLEHQRESAQEKAEELAAELEAEKQRATALAAESEKARGDLERAREQSMKLEARLKEKESVLGELEMENVELKDENRLLREMSPEEKEVYYCMLDWERCTVNDIRKGTGLSDRQVRYALKKLIGKKLVVEAEKGSSRRPSYYAALDM